MISAQADAHSLLTKHESSGALEDFGTLEAEERDRAASAPPPPSNPSASAASSGSSTTPSSCSAPQVEGGADGSGDSDDELPPELMNGLKKLVEEMSKGDKEGFEGDASVGPESEEIMKEALDQLENSPEFASIMEKMMGSLLSKDVLYDPIKQMKEKVGPSPSLRKMTALLCPAPSCSLSSLFSTSCSTPNGWPITETRYQRKTSTGNQTNKQTNLLAGSETLGDLLSNGQQHQQRSRNAIPCRYSKQYDYVQRLCVLYENNSDTSEIMTLMQEVLPPLSLPPSQTGARDKLTACIHCLPFLPPFSLLCFFQMQEHGQPPEDMVQDMAPGNMSPTFFPLPSSHPGTDGAPGFNFGAEGLPPQIPELDELLKGMENMGEGKDKCSLM